MQAQGDRAHIMLWLKVVLRTWCCVRVLWVLAGLVALQHGSQAAH